MNDQIEVRAERHLDAMIRCLFVDRNPLAEPIGYACLRFANSVNAFFDTEAFSVADEPRGCLRIGCACGWSFGLLLLENPSLTAAVALLLQCLEQMVLHYEHQHNGAGGPGLGGDG